MAWLTDPRKWDDDWWAGLSYGARMIFEVCLTGQFRTVLPGLCRNVSVFTLHDACTHKIKRAHLKPTLQQTEEALAEAVEPDEDGKQHFMFDSAARVARAPMAPAYNHADNPNVLTAWYRAWRDVPDCDLKFAHIFSLRLGVNFAFIDKHQRRSMSDKWDATFGQSEKALAEGGKRLKTYVDLRERWVRTPPDPGAPPSPQTVLAFPGTAQNSPVAKGPNGKGHGVDLKGSAAPEHDEDEGYIPQLRRLPPGVE